MENNIGYFPLEDITSVQCIAVIDHTVWQEELRGLNVR
jgi:hypothetical protein